jgi:hypothetical protein
MKCKENVNRQGNVGDIDRAAWFLRLAFGVPSVGQGGMPVRQGEKSQFDVLP